jgi:hypothetical protein
VAQLYFAYNLPRRMAFTLVPTDFEWHTDITIDLAIVVDIVLQVHSTLNTPYHTS